MIPRILSIAGSDSGGGAGIQADIKTITALGGYAMTAVTAVTVQNSHGILDIHNLPGDIISSQITASLEDFGADAIKTGMLVDIATARIVAKALSGIENVPIVADPVMLAKKGRVLLSSDSSEAVLEVFASFATILTPNIPEAEYLSGRQIASVLDMVETAKALQTASGLSILLKGGHLDSDELVDVLVISEQVYCFSDTRIATSHSHGTGCTLASALATGLGEGLSVPDAVVRARRYLRAALSNAPGFGGGHGPMNHAVGLRGRYFDA